jgi:hypothetical protein
MKNLQEQEQAARAYRDNLKSNIMKKFERFQFNQLTIAIMVFAFFINTFVFE